MIESHPQERSMAYSSAVQALGVTAGLRFLGVARGIIVARLLLPEEFGKFALVGALVGLLETTTNSGLNDALIKGKQTERTSLQAVWTVVVARGAVVSLLLLFNAGTIGGWFNDPSLSTLLRVLALTPLIRAMSSLGPVLAQRQVDYRWIARVTMTTQTVEVSLSILLVWILQSAMGLVIGAVIGTFSGVLLSYRSPGFTPGLVWRWSEVRPLLRFARWRWVSQIAWYGAAQGDDLIVGRSLGTAALGTYRIAYTVGNLPTTETATALVQVAFPALARASEVSKSHAVQMYTRYLTLLAGIAGILAVTLLTLADPLVKVLLGEAWLPVIVPLGIMSIGGYCRALAASGGAIFLAMGKPAWDAWMQVVRACVLFIGLAALLRYGVVGAATASTVSTIAILPVWLGGLHSVGVSPTKVSFLVARRAPAIAASGLTTWFISRSVEEPILSLIVGATAGLVVWLCGIFLTDPPLTTELKLAIRRLRPLP
jgi:PST family polysaccharide transporter/lipopolysaccharide exporter